LEEKKIIMLNSFEQESKLRQVLDQANDALAHDPSGQLALPWRNALWLAMGDPQENEKGYPIGAGWQRRVKMGILTVQHLLSIWQEQYPQDEGPQRMLLLAEQVVEDKINHDAAGSESDNYWTLLSDLGVIEDDSKPAEVLPFLVGMAAARVVRTARLDYQMVLFNDPNELDTERDAWMWDESYLGAMAYAGGAVWVTGSSSERRREFWQWWLDQAVPSAYEAVSA
jgi:hypothetical protein